jgi:cyanobactin maturation PatA/PatG family protease
MSEPPAPAPVINPSLTSVMPDGSLIYALGTLGYDFGTEARRDSFKQLMPGVTIESEGRSTEVPANPYDARQMVTYLADHLSEAKSLIWTLSLELTPIYAIEPRGPFAREVYAVLQQLLAGEVTAEDDDRFIERVSVPGRLTGQVVKLFSGQVVPIIHLESPRGMYGWEVNILIDQAIAAVMAQQQPIVEGDRPQDQRDDIRKSLRSFLNRIYYDLRNLGQTSQERALNFAATNAFQAASSFAEAASMGMELDSIEVEKSPFCRIDSDCWDVKLKFFDPENKRRARKVFRFTIDVSDTIPVTLGEVRSWSTPT